MRSWMWHRQIMRGDCRGEALMTRGAMKVVVLGAVLLRRRRA